MPKNTSWTAMIVNGAASADATTAKRESGAGTAQPDRHPHDGR